MPGAIDCYREILEAMPAHSGAREALERRLDDEKFQLDAAGILQPIYEQLGEWLRLIGVHEIQLKPAPTRQETLSAGHAAHADRRAVGAAGAERRKGPRCL